jgi:hypothetical protein
MIFRPKIPNLPWSPVIHLRAIEQSDYKAGIIEMRFTAGENLEFSFFAKTLISPKNEADKGRR